MTVLAANMAAWIPLTAFMTLVKKRKTKPTSAWRRRCSTAALIAIIAAPLAIASTLVLGPWIDDPSIIRACAGFGMTLSLVSGVPATMMYFAVDRIRTPASFPIMVAIMAVGPIPGLVEQHQTFAEQYAMQAERSQAAKDYRLTRATVDRYSETHPDIDITPVTYHLMKATDRAMWKNVPGVDTLEQYRTKRRAGQACIERLKSEGKSTDECEGTITPMHFGTADRLAMLLVPRDGNSPDAIHVEEILATVDSPVFDEARADAMKAIAEAERTGVKEQFTPSKPDPAQKPLMVVRRTASMISP